MAIDATVTKATNQPGCRSVVFALGSAARWRGLNCISGRLQSKYKITTRHVCLPVKFIVQDSATVPVLYEW
jgi:hypothetical protein